LGCFKAWLLGLPELSLHVAWHHPTAHSSWCQASCHQLTAATLHAQSLAVSRAWAATGHAKAAIT
jgi:hypothetical protein